MDRNKREVHECMMSGERKDLPKSVYPACPVGIKYRTGVKVSYPFNWGLERKSVSLLIAMAHPSYLPNSPALPALKRFLPKTALSRNR